MYLTTRISIIACLNGESAQIVLGAGAGITAPAEDTQVLAEVVLLLKGMPAITRQAMGQRRSAYFQSHFDHDLLVDRLAQILDDLSCLFTSTWQRAN